MSLDRFEAREASEQNRPAGQDRVDDREALLGLIALISLAIPALLIRFLFPDLDPLILAALGVAVYVSYLGLMITTLMRRAEREQPALEAAPLTTERN